MNSDYSDSLGTGFVLMDSTAIGVHDVHPYFTPLSPPPTLHPSPFTLHPTSFTLHPSFTPQGQPGTPLPYSIRTDNALSMTLLLCLMLFFVALSRSTHLLTQQAKSFFHPSPTTLHPSPSTLHPSPYTLHPSPFTLFMVAIDCLLLAVASYIYATSRITTYFVVQKQYLVVLILFGLFAAYFLLKWMVYSLVNSVLFGSKKSLQWNHTILFITSLEGILLFPLVFLLVYFYLEVKTAIIYFGFVLILNKILTFYKCWCIFFKQNSRYLQIFLYFCALEIMPLLAFAGLWVAIVNILKVNF